MPLVSVIIPLYNKESSILRTLESVLSQTYTDFEVVVVDDGSIDGSSNIVKALADERIRYIYQENAGVSAARNRGVKESNGEWIVFLDADDYLYTNALSIFYDISTNQNVDIVVANFIQFINGKSRKTFSSPTRMVVNGYKDWLLSRFCPTRTGAAMFRRSVVEKNPFNISHYRWEDVEAIFDMMRESTMYYTDELVLVNTDDYKGLSKPCTDFRKDFISELDFHNKSFWEKLCLVGLIWSGWVNYPNQRFFIFKKYWFRLPLFIVRKIVLLYYKVLVNK